MGLAKYKNKKQIISTSLVLSDELSFRLNEARIFLFICINTMRLTTMPLWVRYKINSNIDYYNLMPNGKSNIAEVDINYYIIYLRNLALAYFRIQKIQKIL